MKTTKTKNLHKKRLEMRLTNDEMTRLRRDADQLGISMSALVRQRLLILARLALRATYGGRKAHSAIRRLRGMGCRVRVMKKPAWRSAFWGTAWCEVRGRRGQTAIRVSRGPWPIYPIELCEPLYPVELCEG